MSNRKAVKKILLIIAFTLIVMQFLQPARNFNGQVSSDISSVITIPNDLSNLLSNACYDCHSNQTNYPWYSYIQPFGWMIENDISRGKEKLNFSEWANLSVRKQKSKMREIRNIIQEGKMPLKSYKLLHPEACLTNEKKELIVSWTESAYN